MTTVQAQWLTLAFVALVTLCVLAFDIWITVRFGGEASISRGFSRLFKRWPAVFVAFVFWLGLLVGHVWLPAQ